MSALSYLGAVAACVAFIFSWVEVTNAENVFFGLHERTPHFLAVCALFLLVAK